MEATFGIATFGISLLLLVLIGAALLPVIGLAMLASSSARRRTKEIAGGVAIVLASLVLMAFLHWDREKGGLATPDVTTTVIKRASSAATLIDARSDGVEEVVPTASSTTSAAETSSADEPTRMIEYPRGDSEGGRVVAHRPGWLNQKAGLPATTDDNSFVLVSARYADVAEAESHLFAKLHPWLARSLAANGHDIDTSAITLADFKASGAIVSRVEETFDVATRSFVEPVHRVSWLVSPSPGMREALVQAALPRIAAEGAELQTSRAWALAGILGGLTLLFGIAALWTRGMMDMQTWTRRTFANWRG